MNTSDSPEIHAGMLKRELLAVADGLGLVGVRKLRKAELLTRIREKLRRGKDALLPAMGASVQVVSDEKEQATGDTLKGDGADSSSSSVASDTSGGGGGSPASPAGGGSGGGGGRSAPPSQGGGDGPPENDQMSAQSLVTAVKYGGGPAFPSEDLRQVDAHLPPLPDGYGEDRLVALPRDPQWMYAYWDLKGETCEAARAQGGENLALRLHEYRDGQLEPVAEHWVDGVARSWYLPVPSSGQSYVVELGYRTGDGAWLSMLSSNRIIVPRGHPSSTIADEFATLWLDEPLPREWVRSAGGHVPEDESGGDHQRAYEASIAPEGGLLSGSQHAHQSLSTGVPSSPPGAVHWAGSPRREVLTSEGEAPERDFWLVADAELVVFGKTEPDAQVTLAGERIRVRPDGSFSVRMVFPDGAVDVPVVATAADGRDERRLDMRFSRETGSLKSRT